MSKKNKKPDIALVKSEVAKVMGESSGKNFEDGVILMSAAVVGPNIVRVAKFARVSREKVRPLFLKLREQKVFRGGEMYVNWFDQDAGGIAFILDVCVAQGMLTCKA